jgi:hypothetical protein
VVHDRIEVVLFSLHLRVGEAGYPQAHTHVEAEDTHHKISKHVQGGNPVESHKRQLGTGDTVEALNHSMDLEGDNAVGEDHSEHLKYDVGGLSRVAVDDQSLCEKGSHYPLDRRILDDGGVDNDENRGLFHDHEAVRNQADFRSLDRARGRNNLVRLDRYGRVANLFPVQFVVHNRPSRNVCQQGGDVLFLSRDSREK